MQALLVTILKSVGPSLLVALKPALLQIVTELIAQAKASSLPPDFAWAAPILTAAEADLVKLLS